MQSIGQLSPFPGMGVGFGVWSCFLCLFSVAGMCWFGVSPGLLGKTSSWGRGDDAQNQKPNLLGRMEWGGELAKSPNWGPSGPSSPIRQISIIFSTFLSIPPAPPLGLATNAQPRTPRENPITKPETADATPKQTCRVNQQRAPEPTTDRGSMILPWHQRPPLGSEARNTRTASRRRKLQRHQRRSPFRPLAEKNPPYGTRRGDYRRSGYAAWRIYAYIMCI